MLSPFPLNWIPRDEPLIPIAVVSHGDTARRLIERVLKDDVEKMQRLNGVVVNDTIILTGKPEDLPWIIGVEYLGVDPDAPHLLLPTNSTLEMPVALLSEILYRKFLRAPIAVVPSTKSLIPTDIARPLDRDRLLAWLSRG